MRNNDLSDVAAQAECRRLLMVIHAQRRVQDAWFGREDTAPLEFDENSAFAMGMTSLFRYARGLNVPAPIVQSFRDELLKLLFCGLASNAIAMPSFRRMGDRPWAHALRLAELRLAIDGEEEIEFAGLSHLLGVSQNELRARLAMPDIAPDDVVPPEALEILRSDDAPTDA